MNSYYEDNYAFIIMNMANTKKTETSVTEIWQILHTTPRTNWRVKLYTQEQTKLTKQMKQPGQNKQ